VLWFGVSDVQGDLGFVDKLADETIWLPPIAGLRDVSGIVEDPSTGDVWFGEFDRRAIGRLRLATGDADGVPGATDNCPNAYNPGQENTDRDYTDLRSYGKRFDDLTWPFSDPSGDACDADIDNDGLSNDVESALPGPACESATGPLDPRKRDTDGDGAIDGAECRLGANPSDAGSRPPSVAANDTDRDGLPDSIELEFGTTVNRSDTDADGIVDGVEYIRYNSDPRAIDTDADGCSDAREVASINADRVVNVMDLLFVASSFSPATHPKYVPAFDYNGDRTINAIDLGFAAQKYGNCSAPS
jgi:hypothetical protein